MSSLGIDYHLNSLSYASGSQLCDLGRRFKMSISHLKKN